MSHDSWFYRICRIIRFLQPARRRSSLHRIGQGFLDGLEPRLLLSAIHGFVLHLGDGVGRSSQTLDTDDFNTDDEILRATLSANVAGSYLTDPGTTDSRAMSFGDIEQGASDTCVFSSVLSTAALTNFSLASGITVQSVSGNTAAYGVRMYSKTTSGSYVATARSVTFDGTVTANDLQPADMLHQRQHEWYRCS